MTSNDTPPPGYVLQSSRVDYPTERRRFEALRKLDFVARMELLQRLNAELHEGLVSALRLQWPAASEEELGLRAAFTKYAGDERVRPLLVEAWARKDFACDPPEGAELQWPLANSTKYLIESTWCGASSA